MTLHSIVIQKLLSTNAHLGRRVAAEHFKIYSYGIRNSQVIIDSDKTLICLRNAISFISHLARDRNARFLFVNTNPLHDEIVEQMTKKIGLYSPRDNVMWRMGGFLTNRFSPKKFRSRNKKVCFAPIQPPDCVVVLDTERKSSVILEAARLQVPIVALVDSSMPLEYYKRIAYPVPANESVQFVYLFCNMITKTFLLEQKLRESKGDVSKKEFGEEVQQIEQSKNDTLVVPYEDLSDAPDDIAEIKQHLDKLVVVKSNCDLGKTMGFGGPKSAIDVHNGLSSLDLTVNQIKFLNSKYGCHIPLVLINTTNTHDNAMKVLEKYSKSSIDVLPLNLESLGEQESKDESNPSDEYGLFFSLLKDGTLDVLLSQGKEYVLHFSSDDAATAIDPKILNHLIRNNVEYCMELTGTTQDPSMHSMDKSDFVDTRNFWVNLKAIRRLVHTGKLKMENFSSSKAVDGEETISQERSIGSEVQFVDKRMAILIPQSQFVQLKTTSDLLLLQSDLYSYTEGVLVRNPARENPFNPSIDLGSEFEQVGAFSSRFKTVPSIIGLDSLKVHGDVWFGAGVTLKGRVSIIAKPGTKLEIPDGMVLDDKEINGPADI
ncbi:UTP--glucose-1-phosphate uridylyltransferase-like [Euphorbia lathyris]|uniref:UTP--glucose-1-phosphate uridylyltransferase-like n=1 Tax=Euphorbia lathyris TaxID=212925 RepID=UPI003313FE73